MKPFLGASKGVLQVVEDWTRVTSIILMTLIVFIQIVARIFFEWSSPALEESARFVMIWSIFIGAVVTTREDSHIKMGGFFHTRKGRVWFELVSKVICFVFMCIFVTWAYDYMIYSYQKGMRSIVLGLPLIIVHCCFFVTGSLMAIHFLTHLVNQVQRVIAFHKGDPK
jgi:TRAP-type C4-dicarboxylate transport system permease small subunit